MNNFIQFCQTIFAPAVLIFTVSNLATMGLQVNMSSTIKVFKDIRSLLLIFVWGWVVGPAFAYLITWALPLDQPYVVVMLLAGLAPSAPFLQMFVEKSRGDITFAGAFIPVVVVATVVLMPLMAPLLVKGVDISTSSLAKPLLLTILLPLIIGAAIRHFADKVATKIFRPTKLIALISTITVTALCILIYGSSMLNTAGSFALLSMTLFMIGMGLVTYKFGFGLKQSQRSVMALGMGTRNIAAVLAAALAIPNGDPRIVTMVVMYTLWSIILSVFAAKILAKQAGKVIETA